MKRSVSAISNLKQNRNSNNTSRTKSPQRVVNGVKLYNFSELGSYKYINRPYLNELKKEHIKTKLDLEKSTETRVARRVKKNDLFIAYSRNPFVVDNRHAKSHAAIPDDPADANRTIITEINNLKQKRLNREAESKDLDELQFAAHNISELVQKQLTNATPERLPFRKAKANKSMIELPPKVREEGEVVLFQREMEFDDIIALKEEKHSQKRGDLNIFRLLHDRNFFNRNLTLLDKYFFSFNSLLEKFHKFKIKIYRDISRQSRVSATKRPEIKTLARFEPFNQAEINFNDLINVAAGRFSPEVVYQQLNLDRVNDNANNSDIGEEEIVYNDNAVNRSTAAENHNQSVKEVEEFLRLALTKRELGYQKANIYRKEEIKRKMEKVSHLVSLSIYDKKLHQELRGQIAGELKAFTDQNYRYPRAVHERDALIRNNKEVKSKNDMIKLEQLIETYRLSNDHARQVKELITKRL